MGTKVSGTPCFFSVAQAALSLTPREGKELDTVLLACRPSNKTFGFFSFISSPLLCSSFSCYKTTPKNQSRNSTEPSQIYAQGHYNNPFPLGLCIWKDAKQTFSGVYFSLEIPALTQKLLNNCDYYVLDFYYQKAFKTVFQYHINEFFCQQCLSLDHKMNAANFHGQDALVPQASSAFSD